jgi:hypothetical protein
LRWVHSNYKTEDYIKKYGEFRPKFIKQKGINIEGKTEHEIMDSLKYYKVWDCGVAKFEWKKEE